MAKTKVYFWLKIDKKFFDNLFIKRLKSMPGGYTMTVIYMRMMLESLESDCILYYEGYFETLKEVASEIKKIVSKGVEVGIVVGGRKLLERKRRSWN